MSYRTIAALLALASLTAPALAERAENFAWHGTIARGHTLTIKNINGSIRVESASGDAAEVLAVKTGEDPAQVRIEQVERNGDVAICAVWPNDQADQPACSPTTEYHVDNHNRHNDTRVNFTARVPRGVNVVLRDINGSVSAAGLASNVDATTINGRVDISTSGSAQATSVNGKLTIAIGTAPSASTAYTTVNGAIDLTVPRAINANFSAQTLNGSIRSDLPISVQSGAFGRMSKATGRFGSGGPELASKTLNGSITLHAQ